ncbi:MAG: O-antigen ligase family protein [Patescibacteria group bacterium]
MASHLSKIYSWLLAGAILLAPLNLFLRWLESQAYLNGIFSDYLIAKIWLAEIPIFLIIIIWLFNVIKKKSIIFLRNKLFIFLLLVIFIRQFFTNNDLLAIISFFRFLELGLLILFLKSNFYQLNKSLIYSAFVLSFFGQIILANSQFFLQRNLFDYHFLGETSLTNSLNIAKVNFKTGQVINPYGSTAHPNILAGFLVINAIILLKKLELNKKTSIYLGWLLIIMTSWTLFLTQAYSAIASFIIFLILQTFKQLQKKLSLNWLLLSIIIIPIILSWFNQLDQLSITRRVSLNQQTIKIWLDHFFWGTGLNNFLYYLKPNTTEVIRFIQPVHHSLLLWLAEVGLVGAGLIVCLKDELKKRNVLTTLFIILPLIALDHYLLTQWLGGWLLILAITLL